MLVVRMSRNCDHISRMQLEWVFGCSKREILLSFNLRNCRIDNLAFCFERGIGIKADRDIANMLYRKSSKMGYAKARGVHACLLYNEAKASIERESALRWFEKAAAHGDEVARANLKRCRRGKKPVPHTGREDAAPDAASCLEGA